MSSIPFRIAKVDLNTFAIEEARGDDVYIVALTAYTNIDAFNHEWNMDYVFSDIMPLDEIQDYLTEYISLFPNGVSRCLGLLLKDKNDEIILFQHPVDVGS